MNRNWTVSIEMGPDKQVSDVTPIHPLSKKFDSAEKNWKKTLQSESNQAYQNGFQNGLSKGQSDINNKVKEFEEIECAFLNQVSHAIPEFLDQMRPQLVQLAYSVAKKFISESQIDHSFLESEIAKELVDLRDRSGLEVHLNESDFNILTQSDTSTFDDSNTQGNHSIFKKSPNVSPGGFVMQSSIGSRDYTRETKFRKIEHELEVTE